MHRNQPHRIYAAFKILMIPLLLFGDPANVSSSPRMHVADPVVTTLEDNQPGSLRKAIEIAQDGDTITFQNGLHGHIILTKGPLRIAKNLTIEGPGAEILAVNGNYTSQVIEIVQETVVTIRKLSIVNGYKANYAGGGIWNEGQLTLDDCVINGNSATLFGGGLYNNVTGDMTLHDTTVSNNHVTGMYGVFGANGGGIWNDGKLTIQESAIISNTADLFGGGVYNSHTGTLVANHSVLQHNRVTGLFNLYGAGAGIYNYQGLVTLDETTIYSNTVTSILGYGGGIANAGQFTATRSTISENTVKGTGGGIDNNGSMTLIDSYVSRNTAGGPYGDGGGIENTGPLTLIGTTVNENLATHFGGGIDKWIYPLTMINSTISGNIAYADGGGIYNFLHSITMTNTTITDNTSDGNGDGYGQGGGIYIENGEFYGPVELKPTHPASEAPAEPEPLQTFVNIQNTLLAGNNTNGTANDCYTQPPFEIQSLGNNLIQTMATCAITGTVESNLYGVDPLLAPLQSYGGPTVTHALRAGSPAVDAGDFSGCPATDQRGVARPVDGNLNGQPACDIGAFELVPSFKLYWTDYGTHKIQRANLDGSGVEDLLTGLSRPQGLALDAAGGKLYWVEEGSSSIRRARLDGTAVETLISGLNSPAGLALDTTAEGKIYWSDAEAGTIARANLDGSALETLLSDLEQPQGLALDLGAGKLYWSEQAGSMVGRVNLDGSFSEIVASPAGSPYGIGLDLSGPLTTTHQVYWTDTQLGTIQRAYLDGTGVEEVLTGLQHPHDFVLAEGTEHFFWSEITEAKIQRAGLDGSGATVLVGHNLGQPNWLALDLANQAPYATPQSLVIPEDASLNLVLFGADPEGDLLIYRVIDDPDHGTLAGDLPGLTYTPAPDFNGLDSFTFEVEDGRGGRATACIQITVTPVNDPPSVKVGANQMVAEGQPLSLNGAFSDPDEGDFHIITWDFGDGTPESTALETAHTFADDGIYMVTLTVSDRSGASGSATLPITVTNVAPSVQAGPDQVRLDGEAVYFSAAFFDPGLLDTHTLTWDFGDGSSELDTLTPVHTYPGPGVYTATLTVTDNGNLAGSDSLNITIAPAANLSLVMAGSANPILPGATLVYQLSVANLGPSPASDVTVVDTLPAQATFQSASPGCTHVNGKVTCDAGAMLAQTSRVFEISVTVNQTAGNLLNTAGVTALEGDPDLRNNTISQSTLIVPSLIVYQNNFEIAAGAPWSKTRLQKAPAGTQFLGDFSNETVRLSLSGLPAHTSAQVIFDLYLLRSWDGNQTVLTDAGGKTITIGPDTWQLHLVEAGPLLHTTFSNWPYSQQTYPGSLPSRNFPALSGAWKINQLGFLYQGQPMDAVYRLTFTIPHTLPTLALDFSAAGLQEITDESWGIDNITISLTSDYRVALPMLVR